MGVFIRYCHGLSMVSSCMSMAVIHGGHPWRIKGSPGDPIIARPQLPTAPQPTVSGYDDINGPVLSHSPSPFR
ncbi:hypothetical protein NXS19_009200 [Fusarium pseudograminearum]|nr:hypothetical protein NXS19_009200 [Fusarium pseudograminearum]